MVKKLICLSAAVAALGVNGESTNAEKRRLLKEFYETPKDKRQLRKLTADEHASLKNVVIDFDTIFGQETKAPLKYGAIRQVYEEGHLADFAKRGVWSQSKVDQVSEAMSEQGGVHRALLEILDNSGVEARRLDHIKCGTAEELEKDMCTGVDGCSYSTVACYGGTTAEGNCENNCWVKKGKKLGWDNQADPWIADGCWQDYQNDFEHEYDYEKGGFNVCIVQCFAEHKYAAWYGGNKCGCSSEEYRGSREKYWSFFWGRGTVNDADAEQTRPMIPTPYFHTIAKMAGWDDGNRGLQLSGCYDAPCPDYVNTGDNDWPCGGKKNAIGETPTTVIGVATSDPSKDMYVLFNYLIMCACCFICCLPCILVVFLIMKKGKKNKNKQAAQEEEAKKMAEMAAAGAAGAAPAAPAGGQGQAYGSQQMAPQGP